MEKLQKSNQSNEKQFVLAAATLSKHCEHVEHCESNSVNDINLVSEKLLQIALSIAIENKINLAEVYLKKLQTVEAKKHLQKTLLNEDPSLQAGPLTKDITWQKIQINQLIYDRQSEPNMLGIPKYEQVRHYALQITKLASLLFEATENNQLKDFCDKHLADIAIIGVKLATLRGIKLPDLELE